MLRTFVGGGGKSYDGGSTTLKFRGIRTIVLWEKRLYQQVFSETCDNLQTFILSAEKKCKIANSYRMCEGKSPLETRHML